LLELYWSSQNIHEKKNLFSVKSAEIVFDIVKRHENTSLKG